MKIVIDIPEEIIKEAKESPNYYPTYQFETIWKSICNGTPLDDLRAEIEQIKPYELPSCDRTAEKMISRVLEIIDRHMGEE